MKARFFSEQPILGQSATLADAEAHHLLHVLRAQAGDEVTLFDGSGTEFAARIERCSRKTVELAILSQAVVDREPPRRITLGAAFPKGDRQRVLVEKCTELGVMRIVPLSTKRSVATVTSSTLEKLRRAVIEASKQCGRNRLLEIAEPMDWQTFVRAVPAVGFRAVANPRSEESFCPAMIASDRDVVWAIGPEGGFAVDELQAAVEFGWRGLQWGSRILRVETAAVALAALSQV